MKTKPKRSKDDQIKDLKHQIKQANKLLNEFRIYYAKLFDILVKVEKELLTGENLAQNNKLANFEEREDLNVRLDK